MAKYFFQYFSIFIYNESLPMMSYLFFKIYKRFYKKIEKTVMQQSMQKGKLKKVALCFITGSFIEPFKLTLTFFPSVGLFFTRFFFTSQTRSAQSSLFDIKITQEISKGDTGNGKELGMANYRICFKKYFNRLVMNATQINFSLLAKCTFIKLS